MYKPVISTLLLAGLAACATGGITAGDSVSKLEQQQKSSPSSAAVNRSLGIAYYKASRYQNARTSLETATRLDPKDGTTALYLGLSAEELGDVPAAKSAYSSYIQYGRTSRVRSQLQSRLAALTRKEIAADARTAVRQEASLTGQPASPTVIAVMPLRFSGPDSSLRPLERGFADLLTTDLARSSQLTLVERSRMQALLDEIHLQKSGATDAASNVRAGKLVRAGLHRRLPRHRGRFTDHGGDVRREAARRLDRRDRARGDGVGREAREDRRMAPPFAVPVAIGY